ncbi:methyltransferase domain-containing protein [Paenibacillus sp. GCM10027629]|uniref:methyltransferase domain-containing protein n=1 Tax=Paenibacillus sp. GCM10027629 TaxID=3273414 RepID=UPI00363C74A7
MAKLNLKYSKNETGYSDGAMVEDEILELVRDNGDVNITELHNVSWPVFYHLSNLRENILNWYPFKKDCTILEVGSGCGAITGLLCEKAKYVASIELTEKRATINYERHKDHDNLEIFVGNLGNVRLDQKFDYVVVNGVLEYAGGFVSGEKPYEEFINMLSEYLAEDGAILIAIENRLGLKYFSGAKEDHLGELFVGLNTYPGNDKVRTFSKSEITTLIDNCDLTIEKFYYPYPDYKFPEVIYSDLGFNKVPLSYDVHSYDTDRYMFFDEIQMQNLLAKEKAGASFANSFLIDVRKKNRVLEQNEEDILYVKINANRDDAFKICTIIYSQDEKLKVKKRALSVEAIGHLQQMGRFYQQRNQVNHSMFLLPTQMVGDDLVCDYLEFPTMETVLLNKEATGDKASYFSILHKFYSMLTSFSPLEIDSYSKGFHDIFGPGKFEKELEFTSLSNVDVLFDNVFYKDNELVIFDYEWFINCSVPVKFVFWRSVKEFYAKHKFSKSLVSETEIYNIYDITEDMVTTFYKWEGCFSANYVKMLDKSAYRKNLISLSNVQTIFNADNQTANLYVDTGRGFNDQEKCQQIYDCSSEEIILEFDIQQFTNVKSIRFDPIEGHLCNCKIVSAEIDGIKLELAAYNAFPFNSKGDLFITTDPIYLVQGNSVRGEKLKIHFSIQMVKKDQIYDQVLEGIESELASRAAIDAAYNQQLSKITSEYRKVTRENTKITNEYTKITNEYTELANDLQSTQNESKRLNSELSSLKQEYQFLLSQKDNLFNDYQAVLNSTSWKFTKPIRYILDNLKVGKKK